jgi:hypothetical protein
VAVFGAGEGILSGRWHKKEGAGFQEPAHNCVYYIQKYAKEGLSNRENLRCL